MKSCHVLDNYAKKEGICLTDFCWRILSKNRGSPFLFIYIYILYNHIFSLPCNISSLSLSLEFSITIHLTIAKGIKVYFDVKQPCIAQIVLKIDASQFYPPAENALPHLDFPIDDTKCFLTCFSPKYFVDTLSTYRILRVVRYYDTYSLLLTALCVE